MRNVLREFYDSSSTGSSEPSPICSKRSSSAARVSPAAPPPAPRPPRPQASTASAAAAAAAATTATAAAAVLAIAAVVRAAFPLGLRIATLNVALFLIRRLVIRLRLAIQQNARRRQVQGAILSAKHREDPVRQVTTQGEMQEHPCIISHQRQLTT